MGEQGEGRRLVLAIEETYWCWLELLRASVSLLGLKKGLPSSLPGGSCDFGVLGAAAEAEPEVSGAGWKVGSRPWWLGLGAVCMSHRSGHLWGRVTWQRLPARLVTELAAGLPAHPVTV